MNLLNRKAKSIKESSALEFNKRGKHLDVLFIGNKFVELHNVRKQQCSLHFSHRRLQRLVLLTEIYYMQIHKEPLIEQDLEDYKEVNGLAYCDLYRYYSNDQAEISLTKRIFYPPYYKLPQKEYETKIDPKLNREVNQIVEKIYNITEFVDSVDLILMLRVDFPADMSVPEHYAGFGGDFPISKKIIYEKFKDFDFHRLKELNEQEKIKMNLEM